MPKRLFAIDSMAIFYRSYFAMIRTPLINSKGLNTSGVFGFWNQLLRIIEKEKPDYLAVVSDTAEPTFRHHQFPEYKATREKMPEDLVEQLPYLPRMIEALELPYLLMPGYEADDIVGTLMRWCQEQGIEGTMVTSDKDYMQLVSENTFMLNHKQEKIGVAQVKDKFGCSPQQVIEVLGLMGDASDNIPGVKGVGEKTAIKLVQEYGSIANLYENLDSIKGKLREKLENDREQAFLSHELVTIHQEVPIDVTLDDLKLGSTHVYDNEKLYELFQELEFKNILKKFETLGNVSPSNTSSTKSAVTTDSGAQAEVPMEVSLEKAPEVKVQYVLSQEDLNELIDEIQQASEVAVHYAISQDQVRNRDWQCLTFCTQPQQTYYLPLDMPTALDPMSLRKSLWQAIEQSQALFVGYGIKAWFQYFLPEGPFSQLSYFDTQLAAHWVSLLEKKFGLNEVFEKILKWERRYEDPNAKKAQQLSMLQSSEDLKVLYHAESAAGIHALYAPLKAQLEQTQMWDAFKHIEMPLVQTLSEMEWEGVAIDTKQLSAISQEFEERLQTIREAIYELSGETFNINSVPELQKVLYEKLAIHTECGVKPKKIKTGNQMSTDEETLSKMQAHPLPQKLLQYRELNKLQNTYIEQLPTYVHSDTQRIHAFFNQNVAATGRLSSDNPNLQNIPIRTEAGRRIRQVFVPSSQNHVLVSADYSQIELRIVAHYSKDPTFLEAYQTQLDIHALTASTIYGVAESEVTREMRSRAKEVNFGLIYKMGPDRLAQVTQTSRSEAKQFIERFFERYSTIHALQEHFLEKARKEGYTQTLLGRRRYLPKINGKGLEKRFAEGAAINTPIQGSAAEVIKLAMNAVQERLKKEQMRSKMIATVHDELLFDTFQDEQKALCALVKQTMESVLVLEVPLVAEVGVGDNWLDAH